MPFAGDQNKFLRGDGTWSDGSDLVLAKSFIFDEENQTMTIGRTTSPQFKYEPVEDYYFLDDDAFYELAKAAVELGLCIVTYKQTTNQGFSYESHLETSISLNSNCVIWIGPNHCIAKK